MAEYCVKSGRIPPKSEWLAAMLLLHCNSFLRSRLQLQSLERTDLYVRRMKTHFGDRAFSAVVSRCWNSLPVAIRLADSVDSFEAQLKTHLFAKAYPM